MKATTSRILRHLPVVLALVVLVTAIPFGSGAFAATGTFTSGLTAKTPIAKFTTGGTAQTVTTAQRDMAVTPAFARKATARTARRIGTRSYTQPTVTEAAPTNTTTGGTELAQAQALLNQQIAAHPILKGATVTFGDARGYQAISYYTSGRIVISTTHTASLERIINHEIWHIIDYRDNGVINWGENVPPANAANY